MGLGVHVVPDRPLSVRLDVVCCLVLSLYFLWMQLHCKGKPDIVSRASLYFYHPRVSHFSIKYFDMAHFQEFSCISLNFNHT